MQSGISQYALNPQQVNQFHANGYVVSPRLFNTDEMQLINNVVRTDPAIAAATYDRKDQSGAATELALWHELGDDVFAAIARSGRIIDSLEAIFNHDMCFFHAKLSLKKPKLGGSWEWHQDYGYWYRDGYLFPHMASVFIALDATTKDNGCLRVIQGSHLLGRIEHGVVAGQIGADQQRVDAIMQQLPTIVDCEMQPGDALVFSRQYTACIGPQYNSNTAATFFLCCYSQADNPPSESIRSQAIHHTPIDKLSDAEFARYLNKAVQ